MKEKIKNKTGPLVLLLLDGLGIAPDGEGNAFSKVKMSFFQELLAKYPSTALKIPTLNNQKLADPILCYSVLGSGSFPLNKKPYSFLNTLTDTNKKWCLLIETERIPLAAFFLNGNKKVNPDNYFLEKKDVIDIKNPLAIKKKSEIPNELIKRIKSEKWDFIGAFLADLEISSRNGNNNNIIQTIERIDYWLKKITEAVLAKNGVILISSAFGKAEDTINIKIDAINKSNSLNNVPFVIVGKEFEGKTLNFPETPGDNLFSRPPIGNLADIAPTITNLLNIKTPKEFSGKILF